MRKLLNILYLSIFLIPSSFLSPYLHAENTEQPICRFGIPPWQKGRSLNDIKTAYQPMLNWLTQQTNCRFIAVGATSYEHLVEQLVTGKVHLAELGPITYLRATQKNPDIRSLATLLIWNIEKTALTDSYFGYILTLKKHTTINSLEDLKNKSFGFVDLESTSGYVYPNALLREKGIDYKSFFGKTYFLGSHPNITDAIVAESIVAGATWQPNFLKAIKKHGDIFKILLQIPAIPNGCVAAHPSLPENIQIQLRQILPNIDPNLLEKAETKGFAIRPDNFYAGIRKIFLQEQNQ